MSYPEITVDRVEGDLIFFWADNMDGDAKVVDGRVLDAQLNHPSVDLTNSASSYIRQRLQRWYNENHDN